MSKLTPLSDGAELEPVYVLQLYITGATQHSSVAVKNIKLVCEEYLKNRYKLEIIDVYQQPQLAEIKQIIAVPTLIKVSPKPTKRLVGNLSNMDAVLAGLNLK